MAWGKWNLLLGICLLSGCDANFHSIYRTTPSSTAAPHSQAVITDAKQGVTVMNYNKDTEMFRVCAARSPDVFSALTTAFQGDASAEVFSKFAAAISGSGTSAESASAFGLRTQLTQSQMELLYQLCLASLNETLTPDQLATEIHRYQNTMVTMLAIEQLTGYARPTVVAIGGQSAVGSADEIAKQQTRVDVQKATEDSLKKTAADSANALTKANEKVAPLVEAQKKAEKDVTDANTLSVAAQQELAALPSDATKEQKDAAEKKVADTKKTLDDKNKILDGAKTNAADAKKEQDKAQQAADKNKEALERQTAARERAEKTLAAMEKQVDISSAANPAQIFEPATVTFADPETAKAISSAVLEIQQTHLNQTFLMDECVRFVYHPEAVLEDRTKAVLRTVKPENKQDVINAIAQIYQDNTDKITDNKRFEECKKHFGAADEYRQNLQDAYYGCETTWTPTTIDGKEVVVRKRTCKRDATDLTEGEPADPARSLPFSAPFEPRQSSVLSQEDTSAY